MIRDYLAYQTQRETQCFGQFMQVLQLTHTPTFQASDPSQPLRTPETLSIQPPNGQPLFNQRRVASHLRLQGFIWATSPKPAIRRTTSKTRRHPSASQPDNNNSDHLRGRRNLENKCTCRGGRLSRRSGVGREAQSKSKQTFGLIVLTAPRVRQNTSSSIRP